MRYNVRINRRIRNARAYTVLKKLEGNPNIVTRLFMRIFAGKKKEEY